MQNPFPKYSIQSYKVVELGAPRQQPETQGTIGDLHNTKLTVPLCWLAYAQ